MPRNHRQVLRSAFTNSFLRSKSGSSLGESLDRVPHTRHAPPVLKSWPASPPNVWALGARRRASIDVARVPLPMPATGPPAVLLGHPRRHGRRHRLLAVSPWCWSCCRNDLPCRGVCCAGRCPPTGDGLACEAGPPLGRRRRHPPPPTDGGGTATDGRAASCRRLDGLSAAAAAVVRGGWWCHHLSGVDERREWPCR